MNRIIIVFAAFFMLGYTTKAQEGYFHQGEIGVSAGLAHYFGDLNTNVGLKRPKPSIGLFFRKQFGDYVNMRVAGRFAQLGYDDLYDKDETSYQHQRGLEFNTNIFEFSVQGDFNFFKYVPGSPIYGFTPYLTLGLGLFSYDPYATDSTGEKVYLRMQHTEGQPTDYSTMSICVPFGVGIKYSVNPKVNLHFELVHRFTSTDYLDDVSSTYVGLTDAAGVRNPIFYDANGALTKAGELQDRSVERGGASTPLGVAGRQRGWSKQKDQYIMAEVGLSINIGTYKCPSAF